jgi:two-component system chemotaxis response regulator CheB
VGPSRLIAIGASAGGLQAIERILGGVPPDIPAAIVIVTHRAPTAPGILATILARSARLPVAEARDGDTLRAGHVYVAPPDEHLTVDRAAVRVARGPKERHHRPAVDPLFRAAARAFGSASVGVVLSGNLDDGAAGLLAIHRAGGTTVVQAPGDALFPGMPSSALNRVAAAHVVPASSMGRLLDSVVRADVVQANAVLAIEQAKTAALEDALWMAMRALEERADTARRRAARARSLGADGTARVFECEAEGLDRSVAIVRGALIDAATKP